MRDPSFKTNTATPGVRRRRRQHSAGFGGRPPFRTKSPSADEPNDTDRRAGRADPTRRRIAKNDFWCRMSAPMSRYRRMCFLQAVRTELLSVDAHCWWCGFDFNANAWAASRATIEHLEATSQGGSDDPGEGQIVVACARCNLRHSNHPLSWCVVQRKRGCGLFTLTQAIQMGLLPVDVRTADPLANDRAADRALPRNYHDRAKSMDTIEKSAMSCVCDGSL